jgi:hypothetical protein
VRITFSKLAALILAIGYIIAAGTQSLSFAGTVALGVLIPLSLILFPEAVEEWLRWKRRGLYMKRSPPWMIVAMGWLFLVGLPLFLLLMPGR